MLQKVDHRINMSMKPPILPAIDQTSTEMRTDGVELTDGQSIDIPLMPGVTINYWDGMLAEPSWLTKLEWNIVDPAGKLLYFSPNILTEFMRTATDRITNAHGVQLSSYYNFNCDLVLTCEAWKHERARGRILICYYPGLSFPPVTTFETVQTAMPKYGTSESLCQRYIWDIEATNKISLRLPGVNTWTMRNMNAQPVYVINDATHFAATAVAAPPYREYEYGSLSMTVYSPYQNSVVAPEEMDIGIMLQTDNFEGVEYVSPISYFPTRLGQGIYNPV